jgi:hypothetical protein
VSQVHAMHVEVVGCTSSGKTTLTRALEMVGRAHGLAVRNGDDFVLGTLGLGWIESEFLRRRLVDAISLPACFRARHAYRELLRLALDVSRSAPGRWSTRLNLARNALRKVGIYDIVRRRRGVTEHVFVDNEGVLQAAHNLFVHVAREPNMAQVDAFADVAPLPDAVVYRRVDASTLRERIVARGHKRVPARSAVAADRFVERAEAVFDRLTSHPRVRSRLVLAEGTSPFSVAECGGDPRLLTLADWVRAGLEVVRQQRGEMTAAAAPSTLRGTEA